MTQLTPEHFELHSMNKAKKFENNKKSLDNEIKDLDFAINRLETLRNEFEKDLIHGNTISAIYIARMSGIINKFIDVLSNLKTKNGTTELTQNQLAKQLIKKGFIEKESDLVNLHLQIKKDKK